MRSPGGIPSSALTAAKQAYRPLGAHPGAVALESVRHASPAAAVGALSPGTDLRSALVSSLTQASQTHSGDLTQALGLIQQMRQQQAAAASAPTPRALPGGLNAAAGAGLPPRGGSSGQPFQGSAVSLIKAYARRYGVDPRAALAVASVEGSTSFGEVGDGGTSYGPFQLHVGGALPRGKTAAWANSEAGIEYALRQIAGVARGKRGLAAVEAIVRRFERPAAPGPEVQRAWARY